mgnify:FL=1
MLAGILILIICVLLGILTGLNITIPYSYSQYIAVAILACLDSVFGAYTANIGKKFSISVFLSGFFGNALIAIFLVYLGDKLNLDLYIAPIIVFGSRILNNFATLRRAFMAKIQEKKQKNV